MNFTEAQIATIFTALEKVELNQAEYSQLLEKLEQAETSREQRFQSLLERVENEESERYQRLHEREIDYQQSIGNAFVELENRIKSLNIDKLVQTSSDNAVRELFKKAIDDSVFAVSDKLTDKLVKASEAVVKGQNANSQNVKDLRDLLTGLKSEGKQVIAEIASDQMREGIKKGAEQGVAEVNANVAKLGEYVRTVQQNTQQTAQGLVKYNDLIVQGAGEAVENLQAYNADMVLKRHWWVLGIFGFVIFLSSVLAGYLTNKLTQTSQSDVDKYDVQIQQKQGELRNLQSQQQFLLSNMAQMKIQSKDGKTFLRVDRGNCQSLGDKGENYCEQK